MMDFGDSVDQTYLDRMVDGELTDREARALLKHLDRSADPENWRRLALTFAEAQAFRQAFQGLSPPTHTHPTHTPLTHTPLTHTQITGATPATGLSNPPVRNLPTAPRRTAASPQHRCVVHRRTWQAATRAGGLISVLLAAFWLGRFTVDSPPADGRPWTFRPADREPAGPHRSAESPQPEARTDDQITPFQPLPNPCIAATEHTPSAADSSATGSSPTGGGTMDSGNAAATSAMTGASDMTGSSGNAALSGTTLPAATVRFVYGDSESETPQVVDVPLISASSLDIQTLLDSPQDMVPAHVTRALENAGHRVQEAQDLWTVSLPGGREAVIPVRQVRVSTDSTVFP